MRLTFPEVAFDRSRTLAGGFENLVRKLENAASKSLTWPGGSGSLYSKYGTAVRAALTVAGRKSHDEAMAEPAVVAG